MSSTTTAHGDALRVLFSVFITAESDSRNIECLPGYRKLVQNNCSLSKVLFRSLYFLRTYTFFKELVCLFCKSLPFLPFENCKNLYFALGFLYNLCPFFHIVFTQLGVIPTTRNKFVKIIAVAECYLIIIHVKNRESKKQPFGIYLPVKLGDGGMPIKKEIFFSHLIYNNFGIGKMAGKTELEKRFHEDKLNMELYQTFRKFSH